MGLRGLGDGQRSEISRVQALGQGSEFFTQVLGFWVWIPFRHLGCAVRV